MPAHSDSSHTRQSLNIEYHASDVFAGSCNNSIEHLDPNDGLMARGLIAAEALRARPVLHHRYASSHEHGARQFFASRHQ